MSSPWSPVWSGLSYRSPASAAEGCRVGWGVRCHDLAELMKFRIVLMVIFTASVAYWLGIDPTLGFTHEHLSRWCWMSLGIGASAAAACAWNQVLERDVDRRMARTRHRPLAAQRFSWKLTACGSTLLAVASWLLLVRFINPLTAYLTAFTALTYVAVYTPLKRVTPLCTSLGAIPGAMPPVLGWTAAGQPCDEMAAVWFGILFLWQFPHFLAIAWLYREQYHHAGLKMLPVPLQVRGVPSMADDARHRTEVCREPLPGVTGLLAATYALSWLAVCLWPIRLGRAGLLYLIVALVVGIAYVGASLALSVRENHQQARRLLWTSLWVLPLLLFALTLDHVRGLSAAWTNYSSSTTITQQFVESHRKP
ncbi:MAG: protoheme IX farnesyltransferase [Planctomycetaceae bacterium]|nr:MAG: protoheme IX farnesyltransferase [Planctomycetaceae bacterium]